MADYRRCIPAVLDSFEGDWSCDPDDPGGETYRGIARKYHPSFQGWKIIGVCKNRLFSGSFPSSRDQTILLNRELRKDNDLQELVVMYLKTQFWDRFCGDEIPSDYVAEEMFDVAINIAGGVHKAGLFLQQALNLLNRQMTLWEDIAEDGIVGDKALSCLKVCLAKKEDEYYLIEIFNHYQAAHYLQIANQNPKAEKWIRGLIDRCSRRKLSRYDREPWP
jgi:lysozyme family protein